MSLIAKEQTDFEPIPEGTHVAVCSAVASLGLQEGYQNGKPKQQIIIRFEFPAFREGDEPRVKWVFYTTSLHKDSNLRRDLEGWRDRGFTEVERKGFDIRTVLGHPCQISIIHDTTGERVKDKIRAISKFTGDGEKPKAELDLITYDETEVGQWEMLPDWAKEKIRSQIKVDKPIPADPEPSEDDDVPFSQEAA
jgi:hypothetical protein